MYTIDRNVNATVNNVREDSVADHRLSAAVSFRYDETRSILSVSFDPDTNVVTIRGGRHGFSRLAELLAVFARLDSEVSDDEHWFEVLPGDRMLTLILNPIDGGEHE
jgi:hypothetical protein